MGVHRMSKNSDPPVEDDESPVADDTQFDAGLHLAEGDDMTMVTTRIDQDGENADGTDKFMGRKERRHSSVFKVFMYDYLGLGSNKIVVDRISKNGDSKVQFADYAIKVNRRNKMQKRVLLITDLAIYNMDTVNYKIKRRIDLKLLGSVSMSTLPDNFFALHIPNEYDYLMVSGRKTEIVTVLMLNHENLTSEQLPINFNDSFEYKIGTGSHRKIQFKKVDGGVSTQIFDKKE
eukprot:c45388_g1_i1.p1 GENE.c45388_g1_i1~~c45388_g1_i1.p1  ORF type:complete len:233 (-),score=50.53 c45388_g1_i1:76-774(-)